MTGVIRFTIFKMQVADSDESEVLPDPDSAEKTFFFATNRIKQDSTGIVLN